MDMKAIVMNKRIILALGMIVFVAAVLISSTGAFFSDTESSTGNVFTAGAIDLKIDSTATYNGNAVESATWTERDLNPTADKFFNFNDIKPGDHGTNTVSVHVINNDAWVCAYVTGLTENENGINEPESEVDSTPETGELRQNMSWVIWRDTNGNGVQDVGEGTLTSGQPNNGVLALYDSTTGTPLSASTTGYIGVAWTLPASVGNEVQTDSMTGDISFSAVQSRNNLQYKCVDTPIAAPLWTEDGTRSGGEVDFVQDGEAGKVLSLTTVNDNDSRVRWTNMHLDYDLSAFTGVSYDSKQVSAFDAVNGNASMRLFIDLDGDTSTLGDVKEITYEPYYNILAHNSLNDASITTGVWQNWATTLADGKFWAGGGFLGSVGGGGSYASNFTLQQVLTAHSGAKIVGISLGMGTYNKSQVVLVDNLVINGSPVSLEN